MQGVRALVVYEAAGREKDQKLAADVEPWRDCGPAPAGEIDEKIENVENGLNKCGEL
jgi:hypothetical protein